MANKIYKDMRFKLDKPNTTGTLVLTDITSFVNQASLQRSINLLEDTALSDANRSVLTGLDGTTLSINGFVNTTTDGTLGPMIAAATSVTSKEKVKSRPLAILLSAIVLAVAKLASPTKAIGSTAKLGMEALGAGKTLSKIGQAATEGAEPRRSLLPAAAHAAPPTD